MNPAQIFKLSQKYSLLALATDPVDQIRANNGLRLSLNSWASDGLVVDVNVDNGKFTEIRINDKLNDPRATDFRAKFELPILQTVGRITGWIGLRFPLEPIE